MLDNDLFQFAFLSGPVRVAGSLIVPLAVLSPDFAPIEFTTVMLFNQLLDLPHLGRLSRPIIAREFIELPPQATPIMLFLFGPLTLSNFDFFSHCSFPLSTLLYVISSEIQHSFSKKVNEKMFSHR